MILLSTGKSLLLIRWRVAQSTMSSGLVLENGQPNAGTEIFGDDTKIIRTVRQERSNAEKVGRDVEKCRCATLKEIPSTRYATIGRSGRKAAFHALHLVAM